MLFNRKLSKCISVVLASSAFCSSSLVSAITDEEFEKYRRINVYLHKILIDNNELPAIVKNDELIFDENKLNFNKSQLNSDIESNIKKMSIYNIVFNTKIDTEIGNNKINDKFDYTRIKYVNDIYGHTNMELFVRLIIYAIIYNTKISDIRYMFNSNHYNKKEQSVNFKKVVYSFFDCFKLLGIFNENCNVSSISKVLKNFIMNFFEVFSELVIKKEEFVGIQKLNGYQEIILKHSFLSFFNLILFNFNNVSNNADICTLRKIIDEKLAKCFFVDIGKGLHFQNSINKNLNNDKNLTKVINNFFEYCEYNNVMNRENVQITCEKIKEAYVKAHEKLNHTQKECDFFGCKKILESPMVYYFRNRKVVDSLWENIFKFIRTIVECC